jgi:DNA-binding SARP family transcriptional activator
MTFVEERAPHVHLEPAGLTVRIIGPVEIRLGQQPVPLAQSRRCRHLLARLLVAEQRPVSTLRLAADLWPDLAPERARACVHTTVSRIRTLFRPLGLELIRTSADSYVLPDGPDTWVDLAAFRREVAYARHSQGVGRLTDAVTAYQRAIILAREDLLAHEPATDWIEAERRVFAREVADARTRLIELHLDADRPDAAALAALGALRDEPADEHLSQLLIKAYLLVGQRRLALDEYWRLNRVLERELGVAPAPATWALIRDLDAG